MSGIQAADAGAAPQELRGPTKQHPTPVDVSSGRAQAPALAKAVPRSWPTPPGRARTARLGLASVDIHGWHAGPCAPPAVTDQDPEPAAHGSRQDDPPRPPHARQPTSTRRGGSHNSTSLTLRHPIHATPIRGPITQRDPARPKTFRCPVEEPQAGNPPDHSSCDTLKRPRPAGHNSMNHPPGRRTFDLRCRSAGRAPTHDWPFLYRTPLKTRQS